MVKTTKKKQPKQKTKRYKPPKRQTKEQRESEIFDKLDKVRELKQKAKLFNAPNAGLPGWALIGTAGIQVGFKKGWENYNRIKQKHPLMISRIPRQIYFIDCKTTTSKKEAMAWNREKGFMKQGLTKAEADTIENAREAIIKDNNRKKADFRRQVKKWEEKGKKGDKPAKEKIWTKQEIKEKFEAVPWRKPQT